MVDSSLEFLQQIPTRICFTSVTNRSKNTNNSIQSAYEPPTTTLNSLMLSLDKGLVGDPFSLGFTPQQPQQANLFQQPQQTVQQQETNNPVQNFMNFMMQTMMMFMQTILKFIDMIMGKQQTVQQPNQNQGFNFTTIQSVDSNGNMFTAFQATATQNYNF